MVGTLKINNIIMKITNPTDTNISVQIAGTTYEVEAGESISNVKPEDAAYWKQLQGFLIVEKDGGNELPKELVLDEIEKEEEEQEVEESATTTEEVIEEVEETTEDVVDTEKEEETVEQEEQKEDVVETPKKKSKKKAKKKAKTNKK